MNNVVVFVHESAVLHAVIQLLDGREELLVHQASTATEVLEQVNSSSIILTDLLVPGQCSKRQDTRCDTLTRAWQLR